jgi:hypothetical protein
LAYLGKTRILLPRGAKGVRAYDLRGRMRWEFFRNRKQDGEQALVLPQHITREVLKLRFYPFP